MKSPSDRFLTSKTSRGLRSFFFNPLRTNKQYGFALVSVLLLMILLSILALGMLSLSAVNLRSSGVDSAQNIARANARMALMIAIGELQRHTGSDTRVTAPANIVDENYPQLLGVWRSWEGTDHEANGRPIAPQYSSKDTPQSGGGRFIDWLVSSAASISSPAVTDPPDLIQTTASSDTIPLLSDGSLMPSDSRQVHVEPTTVDDDGDGNDDGRFAWWVSGENQKALLAQPFQPRNEDVSALVEMGQSHTVSDPTAFGLPTLISDPEPHNPSSAPSKAGRKAISRQTMGLIDANNTTEPHKKFHDLSSYSIGLLTNTATGGWRKDLSILTERWDAIYASYPGGRLPLFRYTPTAGVTANSQVPKPVKPAANVLPTNTAAVTAATPPQSNLYPWSNYSTIIGPPNNPPALPNTYHAASASWESLKNFATAYKSFSSSSGAVTSPIAWDKISNPQSNLPVEKIYNYKHTQRLYPQIARFQFIIYANAFESPLGQNPRRYQMRFKMVPFFTLWNPYNVSLSHTVIGGSQGFGDGSGKHVNFLGFGWKRSPPGAMAVVSKTTYPNPGAVPNNQYRLFTPGNFQVLDAFPGMYGNNANPYDNALPGALYTQRWVDKRTFGCWLPEGTITFKPGEVKIFSPDYSDPAYGLSGVLRLREGYNPSSIIGSDFNGQGNLTANQGFWFLMKTDRVTQPFLYRAPGNGFSLSFGNGGNHFGAGGTMPTGPGDEFHNITAIANTNQANAYWPPTEVDEVGYSVAELVGLWVPIFSTSFGPRITIGTGPGTEQSRGTKGAVQNNALASMSISDPASGTSRDHPVNNTFDFAYHSMSIGSTITPNVSTSKGFIGTGYQSGDGLSRLIMAEIPLRPMASLVELHGWNPRGNNPYPPFQMNLIGNSDATPLIPNNQIVPPALAPNNVSTNLIHDDAYCANHLLFDDWFVSSIAPQPYSFGNNIENDINTVYQNFLKGESRLTNRAYLPITDDSNVTDAVASARTSEIITSNNGWLKVASRFEVEGMFNVNTTSIEAWKALLGRAKSSQQLAMYGADEIVSNNLNGKHVVTRGPIASDVEAGTGPGFSGQFANASEYTGFRTLSDDQIEDLAEKVVEQVRLRGPFLSLSEFVNRQLSSNEDLALAGAIQTAINNLSDDPMENLRDPANSLSDNTMAPGDDRLNGNDYEFDKAADGSSAYGAPGWIRQADILRPIAPVLSVRDDTFTIRAYGDALDKNDKVIAQAWCEATVKRTRDFSDQADAADSINPPTIPRNITFGRKYEIISFRWLKSNEV